MRAVTLGIREKRQPRRNGAWSLVTWWSSIAGMVNLSSCASTAMRVGSVVSSFVGGQEPDDESKNGEFFHAFLARKGAALPATFRGGVGTWQDRRERWHRLDYVGVSSDALTAVSCVEVDQEGTLAVQEREDHRLVNVSLQWSLQKRACRPGEAATSCGS